jgi:hypothetical protein
VENLHAKLAQLNRLLKEIQDYKAAHPESKCSYSPGVIGSLLNAYREGDIGFDDCVKAMTKTTSGVWDEEELATRIIKVSHALQSEAYRGYDEEEYNQILGAAYSLLGLAGMIRRKGEARKASHVASNERERA